MESPESVLSRVTPKYFTEEEVLIVIVVSSNVVTQPKGTGNPVIQRDIRWRLEINDEDRSEFIKP